MEENSGCKECKTWEEDMYWTHFNSLHFFLTIPPNFHDHLVLPRKFASRMKTQLPDKVVLKSPSGGLWKVDLLKSDYILFAGDEWKDFVRANNVDENSLLMFKYDRNSSFEVLIFDQESSCEREGSYFLKKCRHFKSDHDDHNTEVAPAREASSTEIFEDVDEEDFAFVESKKFRKDDGQEGCFVNTQSPLNSLLRAAAKCRAGLMPPHISPTKEEVQTGKGPIRRERSKKRRHMSQEKGQSLPKFDHPYKLNAQHGNQPVGNDTANEPSPISKRDFINIENEDNFQTMDHSYMSKDQSGKEIIIYKGGENSPVTDYSRRVKSRVDKNKSASGTIKEVTPISWIAPNDRESSSSTEENHFQKSGKNGIANGAIKEATPISWRAPNDRESSPEKYRIRNSGGTIGKQKKNGLHDPLKKSSPKNVSSPKKSYGEKISNRRPVTEEEKEGALQRASQKETEYSFTAIMRPTSVYRRFFLNIPTKWPLKRFLNLSQDIILRVGEKTWLTTFTAYGAGGRGLYNGWKRFALDNDLEEYDVLVFTPVSQEIGTVVVLDVEIFRVV